MDLIDPMFICCMYIAINILMGWPDPEVMGNPELSLVGSKSRTYS